MRSEKDLADMRDVGRNGVIIAHQRPFAASIFNGFRALRTPAASAPVRST